MRNINELKRGDRFITRAGQFGDHVQDYFAAKVSLIGAGMLIYAVSANMTGKRVADESELEPSSWSSGYMEILRDATGRWTITWPGKKDGPDLLESVEFPTECVICNGVRSVRLLHGEPLCLDCSPKILDRRICDCDVYGAHILVFCTVCGAAHSTKNIESIGARHVHGIYEDSCACSKGWFFHDCRAAKFVKGSFVPDESGIVKFVKWVDKYKETK